LSQYSDRVSGRRNEGAKIQKKLQVYQVAALSSKNLKLDELDELDELYKLCCIFATLFFTYKNYRKSLWITILEKLKNAGRRSGATKTSTT
jgi:hypothetical protein